MGYGKSVACFMAADVRVVRDACKAWIIANRRVNPNLLSYHPLQWKAAALTHLARCRGAIRRCFEYDPNRVIRRHLLIRNARKVHGFKAVKGHIRAIGRTPNIPILNSMNQLTSLGLAKTVINEHVNGGTRLPTVEKMLYQSTSAGKPQL